MEDEQGYIISDYQETLRDNQETGSTSSKVCLKYKIMLDIDTIPMG